MEDSTRMHPIKKRRLIRRDVNAMKGARASSLLDNETIGEPEHWPDGNRRGIIDDDVASDIAIENYEFERAFQHRQPSQKTSFNKSPSAAVGVGPVSSIPLYMLRDVSSVINGHSANEEVEVYISDALNKINSIMDEDDTYVATRQLCEV